MQLPPRGVLRPRPDPTSRGRQGRLERSLLRLHGLLVLSCALFTILPLGVADATPAETVARLLLTALHLGIAVDLQRRGERLVHLPLTVAGVLLAIVLDAAATPGDITAGLAYSSFALSTARLLRTRWFLATLLVTGPVELVLRWAGTDRAVGLTEAFDAWLLTVALTSSVAVFVDSLEERTRRAEQLDVRARARELELERARERAAAADLAVRVLHDDVLGALHLLVDARPEDAPRVVRSCAATVATVRGVVESGDPGADGAHAGAPAADPRTATP
ncbi:hypothetical protein GCM10027596_05710 [Nocardioides korecus]